MNRIPEPDNDSRPPRRSDWSRRFSAPIGAPYSTGLRTLEEARAWLIDMDSDEDLFMEAAGKLLAAAEGGDMDQAREQIVLAAASLNTNSQF